MKAKRNLIQIWLLCAAMLPALAQAQFTFTTNNGAITITGYTGSGGTVVIPDTTNGLPVTSIGFAAFYGNTSVTSVTIPNSVINIYGHYVGGAIFFGAFETCFNLTNVLIGNSVTNIGQGAFSDCTSLTAITVDTNNLSYSSVAGTLFDKGQMTLIQYPIGNAGKYYTIPNSVTNIANDAFLYSTNLASVTIPDSVTRIGQEAFRYCTSLTNVVIPNSVINVGTYAFCNCTGLTSVTIPDQLTTIGTETFGGCSSLASLTIPNSVTSIGLFAFDGCANLTNVAIGKGVTNIMPGAFAFCVSVKSIYFTGNAPHLVWDIRYADVFYYDTATVYYLPGTTGWDATFGGLQTALWLPQAKTSDATIGVQTNQFGFNINWASGQTVVVEACTNLFNPVWSPVATNTLTDGTSYFSDSQWTNYPGRFYRLRSQ